MVLNDNRLTDDELADFLQRACVQLSPEFTQQLLALGAELTEYRTKIKHRDLIEYPYFIEKGVRNHDDQRYDIIGVYLEDVQCNLTYEEAEKRLKELQNG